jgi:membrane-bound lytic murein transglycosylase MltF
MPLLALLLLPLLASADPGVPTASDIPLPVQERWTGGLEGMVARRRIRMLVPYSKVLYFLDGGTQRGDTYELGRALEAELNKKLGNPVPKVAVIFIPVERDRLIPDLLAGKGDIAAGHVAITEARAAKVDFSIPQMDNIRVVAVTGPDGPDLAGVDDLAGRQVYYRRGSSAAVGLRRLDQRLVAAGREPMRLEPVAANLEDGDLLKMVDAGLFPIAVVPSHKARLWAKVYRHLQVHQDVVVHKGDRVGWAIRKGSPKLKALIDRFMKRHRKGTLYGNILFKRYLESTRWIGSGLSTKELTRLRHKARWFRKYAAKYGFDWLMLAALGYQESHLDPSKRSARGAVGIMQLLPSTARDPNVGISDIRTPESNIHAAAKYLRFLYDSCFSDPDLPSLDRMMLTIAAYNAGPGGLRQMRVEARRLGLDPDRWFHNVEVAAAALGRRETVQYVGNVFRYYTAYRLVMDRYAMREGPPSPH